MPADVDDAARRRSGDAGSITLIALWSVAVIACLLAAASFTVRAELRIAQNALAESRARLAAEAGTQLGLARLLRRHAAGISVFDGSAETWRDNGIDVEIAIIDEAGKVDLNEAPLELLSGLLVSVGRAPGEAALLACNILDWRGSVDASCPQPFDNDPRRPIQSKRFVVPEQLAQVPGFDAALYDAVGDYITVVTRASAIDPLVASRPVLLAIPGATAALVDSFLDSRNRWRDAGVPDSGLGLARALPFVTISPAREYTIQAIGVVKPARHRTELTVRLTGMASDPYQVLATRTPAADRGQRLSPASIPVP